VISIIVPVKNGLQYTRALVETVRTTNPDTSIEWVIVDSGSTDGTLDYVAEIGAVLVPFCRQPFNYCAALNAGAAVATGDVWIMSNNDVEFRSAGSLARLEQLFVEWPVLGVVSPTRDSAAADIEFQREWIYGPCWAVRPEAFRAWGGMPEAVSGYGYDELWTIVRCWHVGRALGYLAGWSVLHHGSVTFGPTGANTTAAMRRNLSRLLTELGDRDLDVGSEMQAIADAVCRRHIQHAPLLLALDQRWEAYLPQQGYAGARVCEGAALPQGAARVVVTGADLGARQWLPWLANELMLQPDVGVVGANGVFAIREPEALQQLHAAKAVGPPAPPVVPSPPEERATFRQRLGAYLHDWRHRKARLPEEW